MGPCEMSMHRHPISREEANKRDKRGQMTPFVLDDTRRPTFRSGPTRRYSALDRRCPVTFMGVQNSPPQVAYNGTALDEVEPVTPADGDVAAVTDIDFFGGAY